MVTFIGKEPDVMERAASFYAERYEKFFLQAARFVSKRGGVLEDAKDIYHDALVLYYEKLMQPGFILLSSEEAYIMGIVKNLWSHKLKSDLKTESLLDEHGLAPDKQHIIIDHQRLYNIVTSAGKKCLDLLSMFYINQSALKDIAASFGFKSEHSAAVQKYKCLEKIRETIKKNSLHHEDFFE
jgi:DNA-directed RNA polymerase specialized sigma24 family protein